MNMLKVCFYLKQYNYFYNIQQPISFLPLYQHTNKHYQYSPFVLNINPDKRPMAKKGENIREIYLDNPNGAVYSPNIIKNQKYKWYSFLFVVFINQFQDFLTIYFFIVTVTQLIPSYRVSPLISNLFPWMVTLCLTYLKEGVDDYRRYLKDKEVNSETYKIVRKDKIEEITSGKLKVGDIVYVEKKQRIPADLVLLKTSDPNGQVFLRTDQLDGETDWKLRTPVGVTQKLEEISDIYDMKVKIFSDAPHKDIYSFVGKISVEVDQDQKNESLSLDNMLWMNTVLATSSAYGCVIYTGNDTRAVMNTSKPRNKRGKTDKEIGYFSMYLCLLSIFFAIFYTLFAGITKRVDITFFRFATIFSAVIPVSLKVAIDITRFFFYQNFVSEDKDIEGCVMRTTNISEDLGRISYFLTDKTGTLTKNEMEMKKIHLGTIFYTDEVNYEITETLQKYLKKKEKVVSFSKGKKDLGTKLYQMVHTLALCHNVTPVTEDGDVVYQASSPDEVAIVKWCEVIGMPLIKRDRTSMTIKNALGKEINVEILHIFPFTSESKRMRIIVKQEDSDEILFLVKGADVVMREIVKKNDWLDEEVGNMAREGLRTLVVGRKSLTKEEYEIWEQDLKKAKETMQNRAEEVEAAVQILEKDMTLMGITGVEDKLQDKVKVTLENLKNAGIKIWMLTGDKIETAISIAISSRLFLRQYEYLIIENLTKREEGLEKLQEIQSKSYNSLVIDGKSMAVMLENYPKEFIHETTQLDAVVCCRCSPTQKAMVARLIRTQTKKGVVCIGDGGNDVSMITEADVGVGIVGKEGNQASLAADFSIMKFYHVAPLLFWHGRNCYKGTSRLVHFIIHRGMIITVLQGIFCALFQFSPIPLYQGVILMGYVTVYTAFPIAAMIYSIDISKENTEKYPELYKEMVRTKLLSSRSFFGWSLISFYQASAIMVCALLLYEHELLCLVTITFTSLIINEILMVALTINTISRGIGFMMLLSLFIYIISFFLLRDDQLRIPDPWYNFFWKILAINAISLAISIIYKLYRSYMNPSIHKKLV
ncbi:Phospholipid-transporting ATPase [Spraguea lophii 42_110]|uniref:Phospholipid-transporting ATPase n=1 Tax=Spraguea lophii (strain 42_110) TaxID=1358809 RepID=S7WAN6_SPRLO|nr:Phospholipid-transporting ATPase [Spraguea lophii 42_110]